MSSFFIKRYSSTKAIVCPACGKSVVDVIYNFQSGEGISEFFRCPDCTFLFARPVLIPELDKRQMDSVEDAELFSPLLRRLHERFIISPEIKRIRKLLGRDDFNMLDIGCGTGWISKVWADSGACVTGLEPSSARGAMAQGRGIRVLPCYIEELNDAESFDLIVIRHVLEHLEHPAEILQKLHARLNPGGLLLIIVPNIDCIGRSLFDTDWTWVLPWHCNFFNPKSLGNLLSLNGFAPVALYQTPSPLWYPESFIRKYPWASTVLGTNFGSMLLFAPVVMTGMLFGMSDNLTVIARAGLAWKESES